MGCSSSKRIDATSAVAVYRPAPTSFAVFDINSIEEPWLKPQQNDDGDYEKPTTINLPAPILEKLNSFESEDNPHSWEEVSKALENLKSPQQKNNSPELLLLLPPPKAVDAVPQKTPQNSFSFHTVEELDSKVNPNPKPAKELRKTETMAVTATAKAEAPETTTKKTEVVNQSSNEFRSVKENIFILRDREEREKEGKQAIFDKMMSKRDPLVDYPEKCPPNGADGVVLYTTSLRGVRRTYDDCTRAKAVLENQRVVFDERDVSLHAEFLKELKELLGGEEGASVPVPRVFVKGRYVGGVDELVELNESGRLGKILSWARVEKGVGRQACEGCGGARFVPCLECGGSCKVVVEGKKERCEKCNENGLVHCPLCL